MSAVSYFDIVCGGAFGMLLVPSIVFFIECVVGCRPLRSRKQASELGQEVSAVVLIPAHNEELVLEDTLRALLPELGSRQRALVIADNCSDTTAAIGRQCGAEVLERRDPTHRGKGYALSFALEHLAALEKPPEVVVVVDADCQLRPHALAHLCERAVVTMRPVQADYVLTPQPSALSRVSAFAFVVRNRVRPLGLHRLGQPCHLTGSGMAFAWPILCKAPPMRGHLVEDLQMGLDLAVLGHAPLLCPEAIVESVLPVQSRDAMGQRRRWEHGQLQTLLDQVPRLWKLGLARSRLDLVVLGLDLCVPPLALLVLLLVSGTVVAAALRMWVGVALPLQLSTWALGLVTAGVALAWVGQGRRVLPARLAVFVPLYVLWKIPLYLAFWARNRQVTWERTRRDKDRDRNGETEGL